MERTTTTSIVLHLLKTAKMDADFLVGAQLEGFGNMVKLSNAPIAVYEGDEYTASPDWPSPKFMHYKPHITVITGIAWGSHQCMFPTHQLYKTAVWIVDRWYFKPWYWYIVRRQGLKRISWCAFRRKKMGIPRFTIPVNEEGCYVLINGQTFRLTSLAIHNFENMMLPIMLSAN